MPDSWLTTNVRLATVMPPERGTPEFGCTEYDTSAEPFPAALFVIDIQGTALFAVQEHPGSAVTAKLPLPPRDEISRPSILRSYRHGAPCCVIRARASLTTISPSRVEVCGLAVVRNVI